MTKETEFVGCKLAVLCGDSLLTLKRDDIPTIPCPNKWDLPGDGREGNESPESCALRELQEEFGLTFPQSRIHYKQQVVSNTGIGYAYFLAICVIETELDNIVFGDEGQCWALMPINKHLAKTNAVVSNQNRLSAYLSAVGKNIKDNIPN